MNRAEPTELSQELPVTRRGTAARSLAVGQRTPPPANPVWSRLLALGLVAVVGCQATPTADHALENRMDSSKAPFTLEIQTRDSNSTLIQIWVTASDLACWSNLSTASTPALWESILSLRLAQTKTETGTQPTPPISGTYGITGNRLGFQPQFPLLPGQTYQAKFEPAKIPGAAGLRISPIFREYQVAATQAGAPPLITAIYPSGSAVPANHLKFYLVFSEPMQSGNIFQYLKLLDAHGVEVPEPFRETELWSVDGRRLTLWFHPGRQKTGVNLNVEIGPVLRTGQRYTLVISGDWRSQRGVALGRDREKIFRAGLADHTQPDPSGWIFKAPAASTRGPLRVTFPEVYDWALLQSQLWVETAAGQRVPGRVEIGAGELYWSFAPAHAWRAGRYRLAMGSVLEDLAGNSLGRPFEVDLQKPMAQASDPIRYRPFEIGRVAASKP